MSSSSLCRRNDKIIIFSDVVFALRNYATALNRCVCMCVYVCVCVCVCCVVLCVVPLCACESALSECTYGDTLTDS